MQSRSASSIAAPPLMDLIGPPAQRARAAEGDLPFGSLVGTPSLRPGGSRPEPSAPPQTAESQPAAVPEHAAGCSDPSLPRCGSDSPGPGSAAEPTSDVGPDDAVGANAASQDGPAESPGAEAAEESGQDPRSLQEDERGPECEESKAEELLAASLAALPVGPAPPEEPAATADVADPGATSSPPVIAMEEPIAGVMPLLAVEESAAGEAASPPTPDPSADGPVAGSGATAAVAAASVLPSSGPLPALPRSPATADRAPTDAPVATADVLPVEEVRVSREAPDRIVDPPADDSADRQEPASAVETWEALQLPPDSPLPPVASAAAAHNDSRPGQQPNPPILPPADVSASARPRIPEAILGSPGAATGRLAAEAAVDSVRLMQRVARAFAAAHERGGEVRLRLSPEELGALRLELQVRDGAMVARVEAETAAARTAIIENLPALRERLAEQGVRIERFDVDLMNQQGGGTPGQSAHGDREPATAPRAVARAAAQPASTATAKAAALPAGPGRLNVIV